MLCLMLDSDVKLYRIMKYMCTLQNIGSTGCYVLAFDSVK